MTSQKLRAIFFCSLWILVGCSGIRGEIEGRVYRSDTDEPVINAMVTLQDPAIEDVDDPKRVIAETTSDAEGYYSFNSVKPGKYTLVASSNFDEPNSGCGISTPIEQGTFFFTRTGQIELARIEYYDDGTAAILVFANEIEVTADTLTQSDIEFPCD